MKKYTISAVIFVLLIVGAIYYTNAPQQGSLIQQVENTFTSTTTQATPVESVPTTTAPATTTATTPSSDHTVTQADNGKVIHVKQGSRVVLSLGEMDWTLKFSALNIINRVKNIAVMRGSQGVYTADNIGTTVISAEGRPHCDPGMLCAQYIVSFTTTIIVEK